MEKLILLRYSVTLIFMLEKSSKTMNHFVGLNFISGGNIFNNIKIIERLFSNIISRLIIILEKKEEW